MSSQKTNTQGCFSDIFPVSVSRTTMSLIENCLGCKICKHWVMSCFVMLKKNLFLIRPLNMKSYKFLRRKKKQNAVQLKKIKSYYTPNLLVSIRIQLTLLPKMYNSIHLQALVSLQGESDSFHRRTAKCKPQKCFFRFSM